MKKKEKKKISPAYIFSKNTGPETSHRLFSLEGKFIIYDRVTIKYFKSYGSHQRRKSQQAGLRAYTPPSPITDALFLGSLSYRPQEWKKISRTRPNPFMEEKDGYGRSHRISGNRQRGFVLRFGLPGRSVGRAGALRFRVSIQLYQIALEIFFQGRDAILRKARN